jgi:type I restriction-modification system DNA methylase subunit
LFCIAYAEIRFHKIVLEISLMIPMNNHIENRLWAAADQLWANSPLKPSEYSAPVLGLIFLKYADFKFKHVAAEISAQYKTSSRREPSKIDFQSKIGMSITEGSHESRYHPAPA